MQHSLAVYDWNDLRCFLAVARGGSTLAAGKELGVNPTTVARRVAALEEALDVRLFDRLQAGYRLTEAGEEVRADAERVELEARALHSKVVAKQRRLEGVIRVTTNEIFANTFLTPCLSKFGDLYPDIHIDVAVSDRHLDLIRGEADVSLRGGRRRPDTPGLVIRKLADVAWGVYASRDYVIRYGCPENDAMLDGHHIIGGEGPAAFYPGTQWLVSRAPRSQVTTRSTSLSNLMVAVKAGLGLGVLPCFAGDQQTDIVRCLPPIPELDTELWMVTTETLKDLPRIRAFNDFVAARIGPMRPLMLGRQAIAA